MSYVEIASYLAMTRGEGFSHLLMDKIECKQEQKELLNTGD